MRPIMWGSLLAALCALAYAGDARACGGCFVAPPQGNEAGTIVTSHRMALSISNEQTILWDQIQYTGSPAEFAWVLPVKPGARIDVGSEAWFDVLDAATGTAVAPPLLECRGPAYLGCSVVPGLGGATFGCGASEVVGPDGTEPEPVQVVSHGATGPYESAIIHSDVPGALTAWLDAHGYAIPDDVAPVIEAYQAEGFDFAALRLLPSAGVQQMRPVRVVTKGASPVLPLRMVAAGTGARTAITLFVLGEGRYTTKNIPEVAVQRQLVNWDYDTATSTYARVRDATYGGGKVFFSPYSQPGALFDRVWDVYGQPTRYLTTNGWENFTIAEAYAEQAFAAGETSSIDCIDAFEPLADDDRRVVMPCDDPEDPVCGSVDAATEIDARQLECDPPLGSDIPLDDLSQALLGMHPADVWVTRLEANLSREALAEDLILEAAPEQEPVSGTFRAGTVTNIPPSCRLPEKGGAALDPVPRGRGGIPGAPAAAMCVAFLGVLLFLRRLSAGPKRAPALGAAR